MLTQHPRVFFDSIFSFFVVSRLYVISATLIPVPFNLANWMPVYYLTIRMLRFHFIVLSYLQYGIKRK